MPPTPQKRILLGLTLEELTTVVTELGMPRFTARQIAGWLYDKRVSEIDEMTNISKANRLLLSEHFEVGRSLPITSELSRDGTRKYLFRVRSGGLVEAVYIPEKDRATLCISSQVGCKMDCLFCMTGKQGFTQAYHSVHRRGTSWTGALPRRDDLSPSRESAQPLSRRSP